MAQMGHPHSDAQLISEATVVAPGKPFFVGMSMKMDSGWHTYWMNPGDSGMPISIKWNLPAGWKAGEIQWATPNKLDAGGGLVNFGYEDKVLLPVEITPPADAKVGDKVDLNADVDWLICSKMCLQAAEPVTLGVEVGSQVKPDDSGKAQLDSALAKLPEATPDMALTARKSGDSIDLSFPYTGSNQSILFLPADDLIAPASPTVQPGKAGTLTVRMKVSQFASAPAGRLKGLLVIPDRPRAIVVDVPITAQ